MLKEATGAKVRRIELSLLQRCAGHCSSKTDIEEAFSKEPEEGAADLQFRYGEATAKTADEIAAESMKTLLDDMPVAEGEEVCILINGLGATSIEELYILCNSVRKILDEKGIKVYRTFVGEYATSMEMAGASISICRMADDEMKEQIDMPVKTPFYTQA